MVDQGGVKEFCLALWVIEGSGCVVGGGRILATGIFADGVDDLVVWFEQRVRAMPKGLAPLVEAFRRIGQGFGPHQEFCVLVDESLTPYERFEDWCVGRCFVPVRAEEYPVEQDGADVRCLTVQELIDGSVCRQTEELIDIEESEPFAVAPELREEIEVHLALLALLRVMAEGHERARATGKRIGFDPQGIG